MNLSPKTQQELTVLMEQISADYKKDCNILLGEFDQAIDQLRQKLKNRRGNAKAE